MIWSRKNGLQMQAVLVRMTGLEPARSRVGTEVGCYIREDFLLSKDIQKIILEYPWRNYFCFLQKHMLFRTIYRVFKGLSKDKQKIAFCESTITASVSLAAPSPLATV